MPGSWRRVPATQPRRRGGWNLSAVETFQAGVDLVAVASVEGADVLDGGAAGVAGEALEQQGRLVGADLEEGGLVGGEADDARPLVGFGDADAPVALQQLVEGGVGQVGRLEAGEPLGREMGPLEGHRLAV